MYKDSSKCFLTSHLNFCNRQVCGLPNNQLHKLQRIQNAAARLICNVGRFEHITPHHCTGSIGYPLTIESSLKSFFLYIKPSTVSLPPYISKLVNLKTALRYNLRNSDDTLLLSNSSFKSRIILGDRSFKYAGPKLWNELLRDIRYVNSEHIFKRLLKTHLFRKAYLL